MTKRKEQPKTPKQLADEHWDWQEGILLEEMRMKMMLFKGAFEHGFKHGKERKDGKVQKRSCSNPKKRDS